MRLLWLVDVLRGAGLTVHEVSGWRSRGDGSDARFDPHGIICHETRGSRTSTDAGEIRVLLEGSETAPPPIAQLYLSRTGDWHVVASGRCNHVRVGWAGPFQGVGNTGLLGIEAQHALDEPWTDRQYRSYVRGVAAIRRRTGWGIGGHKEHQPAGYGQSSVKTDPSFSMDQFRRDVAQVLAGEDDDMPTTPTEFAALLRDPAVAKALFEALWRRDDLANPYGDRATNKTIWPQTAIYNIGGDTSMTRSAVVALTAEVGALRTVVEALATTIRSGGGSVDTAAILAGVDARVTAAVRALSAETRDAVADLGEGGAARVRGPQ